VGQAALRDGITIALALIGALLLLRFRTPSLWLVLGGAGEQHSRLTAAYSLKKQLLKSR